MDIAIYELNHLEWVIPLCRLLGHTEHNVHFFTSSTFEADLRATLEDSFDRFYWTFTLPESGRLHFYTALNRFFHAQAFDLILLNTVDAFHGMLYWSLRTHPARVLTNLHDINNFFAKHVSFSPRQIVRTAGKRLLAKRSSSYLVNFDGMQRYIYEKGFTTKPVHVFSPVWNTACTPSMNHVLSVVIPGSIDVKRRDYRLALHAWELLNNKQAILTLAGRPVGAYGWQILEQAEAMVAKGFSIRYSTEEIPDPAFQQMLADADLILAPITVDTVVHDGIPEQYGRSKSSGNIYDAIRHGKPLLIPERLAVPTEIVSGTRTFVDAESLADLLRQLQSSAMELATEAYKNSAHFTREKQVERLCAILETVRLAKR